MSTLQNPSYAYSYNGSPYGWSINQFNQTTLPWINQMQAMYSPNSPWMSVPAVNNVPGNPQQQSNNYQQQNSSQQNNPQQQNNNSQVISDVASALSSVIPTGDSGGSNGPKWKQTKFAQKGGWQALGYVSDAISGLFAGDKAGYQGEYGDLQQAGDKAFDAASDVVMAINPMVGGIMKAGGLVSDVLTTYGGMGTDSMTKTDAILGSKLLSLTPFGMINGWGGTKTQKFNKDMQAFETVGSSYTGTEDMANDALSKADKKYGLFSSHQRNKADQMISEAKRQQNIMSDIADEASDRFAIRDSMSAINGNRRKYYLQGGYNQANVRVGKSGMSLDLIAKAKKVLSQPRKLQTGGTAKDPFEYYVSTLPVAQRDSSNFRVRDYWQYNGQPKDFDEAKKRGMFEWVEDFDSNGKSLGWSWHAFTVAKNPNADEYDFMKSSSHPTVQKELDWYNSNSPDAVEFRNNYELQRTEPYWKYVRRKRDTISHKEGGQMQVKATEILIVEPELIEDGVDLFKDGGAINIIPEGALHAHKHNMDMEGITPKGIPVVSNKEGGEVEQQAEIEREEIIFRLEVTKKLEELEKKFYDSETSQKEKDECALEAGKLLVEEILYNTQDNTNKLL